MVISIPNTITTADYIIYQTGTTIAALNGITGNVDYQGTDAATVINNAINNLPTGGLIHTKAGDYILNSPLQLKSQIPLPITNNQPTHRTFILQGEGQNVTRFHNNASTEAITLWAQKSVIRELAITSDISSAGNGINVSLNPQNPLNEPGANNNIISKVEINSVNIGIQFVGACNSNSVIGSHINYNRSHGIDLEAGTVNGISYIPTNNTFTQVPMDRNNGYQYKIGSGKCTSITNTEWYSPTATTSYGIYMDNADGTVISNVYCDSCGSGGSGPIAIYGTNNCVRTIIIASYFPAYGGSISIPNPYLWIHG